MPAVTRIGDMDIFHCSLPYRLQGSSDVFANKKGVSRKGDLNTPHLLPGGLFCPTHSAPISIGSVSVFANKFGVGRIGDLITACTAVAQGSPDVFAGSGAGAGGMGTFSSLAGGLNIGEMVTSLGQVAGQVQQFASMGSSGGGGSGGGSGGGLSNGFLVLTNLQVVIGPGSTVTGQTSGHSFTFNSYTYTGTPSSVSDISIANTGTQTIVSDSGEYIVIQDYFDNPSQNLTLMVITT